MSWENILKLVRTNDPKEWTQNFVLRDKIWAEAGGATWNMSESEGYRFMTIDDVEETLGRKLKADDFQPVEVNWKTTDPQVKDRIGQEGLENMAEMFLQQIAGEVMFNTQIYFGSLTLNDVIEASNDIIKLFPNTDVSEYAQIVKRRAESKMGDK